MNGFDDVLVGAMGNDNAGGLVGEAYVVFGASSGFGTTDGAGRQVIDVSTLTPAQGFVIRGDAANDRTGRSVSSAGDLNGDGFDDIIVSANYGSDGKAYVIYGSALGGPSTPVTLSGASGAETLMGGRGADTLSGGGGGGGADALIGGAGMNVDFTTISDSRISGIERLDLTGTGDNAATLSAADVFHFSSAKDTAFIAASLDEALVVLGNAGDVLNLEATSLGATGTWTQTDNDVGLDGSTGCDFDIYTYSVSGSVRAFIAVDADVSVNMI